MTDWIARLRLVPHPEGGYFRRIYTDPMSIESPTGHRPWLTSIQYLLTRDQPVGCLHRNAATILHFLQSGGPVDYWLLSADGVLQRVRLGYAQEQTLFLPVTGGTWKASRLAESADHALVAEVVVPGFDPADHEFMDADALSAFPLHFDHLRGLLRSAGDTERKAAIQVR